MSNTEIHKEIVQLRAEIKKHDRLYYKEALPQIDDQAYDRLKDRLAERELQLDISESFLDHLVQAGFDPVYGARPLKRAIQQELENPLAQRILAGEFEPGQTVRVDLQGDEVVFSTG